jgi:hypothetical protein
MISKKNIYICFACMLSCFVIFYLTVNNQIIPWQIKTNIISENKPKITLILKGGLGNQFFQYAAAYSIAKTNNYELLVDINSYDDYIYNEICGYVLDKVLPNIKEIKQPFYAKIKNYPKPICFFSVFFKKIYYKSKNIYLVKNSLFYDSEINKIKPNTYIEGYFENYNYFVNFSTEIIAMFSNLTLSKNGLIMANKIQQEKSPTVAIHYREYSDTKAGGVKAVKFHGNLGIGYYAEAIKIIKEKYNATKFYVFSNKIETAKKLFATINDLEFIEYSPDNIWEDMKLMSLCDHNIIANSTYSYWAAYLNTNENKIVIAPQQLFLMQQDNNDNIYPNDWIKITSHFQ